MSEQPKPGGVITDVGSTRKNKTGSWRLFKPVLDKAKCIGCGICAKFCPEACINIKDKKAVVDLDYCKGCGICANECPAKAVKMELEVK